MTCLFFFCVCVVSKSKQLLKHSRLKFKDIISDDEAVFIGR